MSKKNNDITEEIMDGVKDDERTDLVETKDVKKKVNVKAIVKIAAGSLLILAGGLITAVCLTGKSDDSDDDETETDSDDLGETSDTSES